MLHLDLFSGIGGFALACQWAGIETIGFVEIDKYCQKVLRKRFPDVPIVEDIRDVEQIKAIADPTRILGESGSTRQRERKLANQTQEDVPNTETDRWAGSWDTRRWGARPKNGSQDTGFVRTEHDQPAILVTAGFPCQPFSVAGKRGSTEDDRYLWPETLAVIKAVKPSWILLENVTGIINLALDTVLSDLEGAGYAYETLIIPACAVNAWHRRDRVWIVANSRSVESRGVSNIKWPTGIEIGGSSQDVAIAQGRESREQAEPEGREDSGRGSQEISIADTTRKGLQRQWAEHKLREVSTEAETAGCNWWAVEPELGRVAHGIPARVDRLKCLGNAIVPQVAFEIIKVIVGTNE